MLGGWGDFENRPMTIPFLPDLPWALLGRFCFMGLPTNLWVVSGWEFQRASMENECIPMQSRVWVVCQNDPGPQEHRDASAYYPPFAVPAQGVCLRESSLFPGRRSAINSSAIAATQGQPADLIAWRRPGFRGHPRLFRAAMTAHKAAIPTTCTGVSESRRPCQQGNRTIQDCFGRISGAPGQGTSSGQRGFPPGASEVRGMTPARRSWSAAQVAASPRKGGWGGES